jgi:predicted transcriptional regulator
MAVKEGRQKQQQKSDAELREGLADFIAICTKIDGNDVRLYVFLSNRLNFTEPVFVPQVQMVAMLGKHQAHISRSLKKLVDAGVLLPGPEGTRASKWMFNPDYGT